MGTCVFIHPTTRHEYHAGSLARDARIITRCPNSNGHYTVVRGGCCTCARVSVVCEVGKPPLVLITKVWAQVYMNVQGTYHDTADWWCYSLDHTTHYNTTCTVYIFNIDMGPHAKYAGIFIYEYTFTSM